MIQIPTMYQPPPMPPLKAEGYVPEPRYASHTSSSNQRKPGQLISRPARAAAPTTLYFVEERHIEVVNVAPTYEMLDAFLQEDNLVAGCAPPSNAPIVVKIVCNRKTLGALADPGSGENLMLKVLTCELGLESTPLQRPVRVNLAIANGSAPEVLKHVMSSTFGSQEPVWSS